MTIRDYDRVRPSTALAPVHTLCHAPFTVMDLGPQGQVTTCNHFHRFIGNLNTNSWLEIFRGEDWTRLRQNMLDYKISESDCRHCSRQIRSGHPGNAFAQEHFDAYPAQTASPKYPTVIIFRLSNVCNLMCVMCNGTLSHRIRKEREKLPPLPPPPYDEKFFQEMEETLPNVRYVEFYGGEPFLVKEHLRILDILEKTGAKTEIYVNTNGTAITPRIKGYIERLNFVKIAVSVDAIHEDIHARQRVGIHHDVCMENLKWMLDLRARKKIWIGLNTTETRFNWYHLPVMYDWAADHDVYVHINTCLHPSDTTIYDLPTEEIEYIGDFFARWKSRLGSRLDVRGNRQSYGHLEAMVQDELHARRSGKKRPNPYPTDRDPIHGGLMWVPELRRAPIATPQDALVEIERIQQFGAWDFALRVARSWMEAIPPEEPGWSALIPVLEELRVRAEPLAAEFARRRTEDDHRRTLRAAWKLEQQGRFAEVLASLVDIPNDSEHHGSAELLRARALRRSGRLDEARSALDSVFPLRPTDPMVFVELAWLSADNNEVESGLMHARRARSLVEGTEDRDGTTAWAHVLGHLAVRAGLEQDLNEAVAAVEKVSPNSGVATELRYAVERFDEVRDRFTLASAEVLERAGRFDEALALLDTLLPDSAVRYEIDVLRARCLRRARRFDPSEAILEAVCHATPGRPDAWVERAWLAYDRADLDRGSEFAERACRLGGESVAAFHVAAVMAVARGDGDAIAAALGHVFRLRSRPNDAHPDGPIADALERKLLAEAWGHESRGEYREAEACAERVHPRSPRRREALAIRSRSQRRRGEEAAAFRTLALSFAIEPVQFEGLIELAWAFLALNRLESGLAIARFLRDRSVEAGQPLGVVSWAHPLGILAASSGDSELRESALAALQSVAASEHDAASAIDVIRSHSGITEFRPR
jgi:sulfatase maturation enzyme AslB (radical SAM superfamily)/tetratricopeptide (TPR) repeat protein